MSEEKTGVKAWAYIVMEEGEETVVHLEIADGSMYPMMGIDRDEIAEASKFAQAAANEMKEKVMLVEFYSRREIRVFEPQARPVIPTKAKVRKGLQ